MSSNNLIAVLGATGGQGGSVANTFIEKGWRVRAITRNTSSTKAKALTEKGAEVVQADLDDASSLIKAFEGAHTVFAVSDFWGLYFDPSNRDRPAPGQPLNVWAGRYEVQQLKNAIDAAAQTASLQRFVLSSLPNANKSSGGKYKHMFHFDSKADAEEYARETYPDLWAKTSIYLPAFFLANFSNHACVKPTKLDDGTIRLETNVNPDAKLPWIASEEDSGPFVFAMVEQAPGLKLAGFREIVTLREVAAAWTEVTGTRTEIVQLPRGKTPIPMEEDLKLELEDNWAFLEESGFIRWETGVTEPKDLRSPPELGTVLDHFRKQDWSSFV